MDGNAERDIDVAGARSLSQGLQERVQVRPRDLESSVQRSRPGISAGRPRCSTKWPTSTNIENFLIPRQRHPRFVTFVTPPSRQRSASKLRSIRLISAAMRDRDEPTPWGSSATATGERWSRKVSRGVAAVESWRKTTHGETTSVGGKGFEGEENEKRRARAFVLSGRTSSEAREPARPLFLGDSAREEAGDKDQELGRWNTDGVRPGFRWRWGMCRGGRRDGPVRPRC